MIVKTTYGINKHHITFQSVNHRLMLIDSKCIFTNPHVDRRNKYQIMNHNVIVNSNVSKNPPFASVCVAQSSFFTWFSLYDS